jgi:excisionase family DNA binding protein
MDTSSTSNDLSVDSQMDRLTVPEAAALLGVTQAAIYKRISRGKMPHDKDVDGHVHVYLDTSDIDMDTSTDKSSARSNDGSEPALKIMEEQLEYLREIIRQRDEEIRRRDLLLATALERIPALEESSSEPRDSSVTVSEEPDKGTTTPPKQESSQRRSWLHRFFFGA